MSSKLIGRENDFLDDLITQLKLIISVPTAFQERYNAVEIINFEHFNYSIHYKAKDNGSVIVYRVLNQNQEY